MTIKGTMGTGSEDRIVRVLPYGSSEPTCYQGMYIIIENKLWMINRGCAQKVH